MISEVKKLSSSDLEGCLAVFKDGHLNKMYNGQVLDWVHTGIENNEIWGAIGENGEIIAAMWVEETGFFHKYPYLALIGVKESFQGHGHGTFLLKIYEAIGRVLQVDKITLMVGDFNINAKRLYEKLGYVAIGKVDSAYMPDIDEYIMIKNL